MKPFWIAFVLCAAQASRCQAPTPSKWVEDRVDQHFAKAQSLPNGEVWRRPWHFIVLFNSSNAAAHSGYTEAAKVSVKRFLSDRIGSSSTADFLSFYPYQLDAYTTPDRSISRVPLSQEALQRLETVWPTKPFPTLADGKTPYPALGGHDNIAARTSILRAIAEAHRDEPTLVLQITDTTINEAPGEKKDDLIRNEDGRLANLQGTQVSAYDVPGLPFDVGPNQRLNIWLYGPMTVHTTARPPTTHPSETGRAFPFATLIKFALGLAAVGLVGVVLYRLKLFAGTGGGQFSVQIPGNGPIILRSGDTLAVATAGTQTTGPVAVVPAPGLPSVKLFEIKNNRGKLETANSFISVQDLVGVAQPQLQAGTNELIMKKDTFVQRLKIDVLTR